VFVAQQSRGGAAASGDGAAQIDVEVGLAVRCARLARGFSQSELADALGITFQQIQKYERGANRMAASRVVTAARFLGVRSADLLPPDDGGDPMPDFAYRFTEVRGAAEIVKAYCAIQNPAERRALLQLARAMVPKPASSAKSPEEDAESERPQ
jgi:transcriptional regulator with XRE-family HTH domain